MQAFPNLDELLMNPAVAAAVVVAIIDVIGYMAGLKPHWLALPVSLAYMVVGYLVSGRSAPDQLFLAVVYALLIVAPLTHVDGTVLSRLFGAGRSGGARAAGGNKRVLFQSWL